MINLVIANTVIILSLTLTLFGSAWAQPVLKHNPPDNLSGIDSMGSNASGLDAPGAFLPGPNTKEGEEPRDTGGEGPEGICDDKQDNDGDGNVDLDDSDCTGENDEEPDEDNKS